MSVKDLREEFLAYGTACDDFVVRALKDAEDIEQMSPLDRLRELEEGFRITVKGWREGKLSPVTVERIILGGTERLHEIIAELAEDRG